MSKIRSAARAAVVRRVARDILPAEAAVDNAFAELARFASTIPQARIDAGLSVTVGQPIYVRLAESMSALVGARGSLIEAHAEMSKVSDMMGVDPATAVGPLDKSDAEAERTTGLGIVQAA